MLRTLIKMPIRAFDAADVRSAWLACGCALYLRIGVASLIMIAKHTNEVFGTSSIMAFMPGGRRDKYGPILTLRSESWE